jgi:hypothetical protein
MTGMNIWKVPTYMSDVTTGIAKQVQCQLFGYIIMLFLLLAADLSHLSVVSCTTPVSVTLARSNDGAVTN